MSTGDEAQRAQALRQRRLDADYPPMVRTPADRLQRAAAWFAREGASPDEALDGLRAIAWDWRQDDMIALIDEAYRPYRILSAGILILSACLTALVCGWVGAWLYHTWAGIA